MPPLPSHIAWRVAPSPATLLDAVRALLSRPGLSGARTRGEAVRTLLDREARAQGCVRLARPRRWMTAAEYEEYRLDNPGYRRSGERHRKAWKKVPRARRRAIASMAGSASARARRQRRKAA